MRWLASPHDNHSRSVDLMHFDDSATARADGVEQALPIGLDVRDRVAVGAS